MSPAGLAKAFAGLAAAVLAISVGFAMAGAWLVLPFAGLEVLALGAAYLAYARRFDKQEEKRLTRGSAK
jgi:uncharacterized membrane protein